MSEAEHPDLYFDLRGGVNLILGEYFNAVNMATLNFYANVSDLKAAIITTYNYAQDYSLVSMQMFYDALTPLLGVFNEFLAIPAVETDVFTCSFLLLVQASASNSTINTRSA
ncbi:hypothetical protein AcV5_003461 [Taiwanofungus camphoratus]|nr:hypothetical protein AcV5_003461 [Antrodia cinnamomea]